MDFEGLLSRLFRWLPIFLILMILMGIVLYGIRMVLPHYQQYDTISKQVGTQQAVVSTQVADQNNNLNLVILNQQITNIQTRLDEAGSVFLSKNEAEQVLNRMYGYAYSRGVRVTNLQAQQPAQPPSTGVPFDATVYQIQVTGGVANLVDFVSHFQEASLPSVNIASMTITRSGDQATLTMGLTIYTSPYASGQALSQIPTPLPTLAPSDTPTPTETFTVTPSPTYVTPITPSATPTPSLTPTSSWTPSPLPPTNTPTNTLTPTNTPTPIPTTVDCPGAPVSLLREGDVAIVHFDGLGALRMLSDPNGNVMGTRTQAYDNDRLEIITGPVCSNGALYWYVRNTSRGNTLGWAAEGKDNERYMCPEADPECSTH